MSKRAFLFAVAGIVTFFLFLYLPFKNTVILPFLSPGGAHISFIVTTLLSLVLVVIVARSHFARSSKIRIYIACFIFFAVRLLVILAYAKAEVIVVGPAEFLPILFAYILALILLLQALKVEL